MNRRSGIPRGHLEDILSLLHDVWDLNQEESSDWGLESSGGFFTYSRGWGGGDLNAGCQRLLPGVLAQGRLHSLAALGECPREQS